MNQYFTRDINAGYGLQLYILNVYCNLMNRQQQIESYEQIQEYLQKNNIYGIFSQLVQQVILEKPANILDFVIQKLQAPQKYTLFVVGPPGLSINTIIKKTLASSERPFELFNCGEQITEMQKRLSEQQMVRFKSCRLVGDDHIGNIIDKIQKISKSDKNYIIEGFPKNLRQAHILQHRGVYAKNVLIININNAGLRQICEKKLRSLNPQIEEKQLSRLIEEAISEHRIFLNEVKSFYRKYLEIDLSRIREEQYIIQELNKAFSLKTIQPSPRVTTEIIVVGAPFSGRTTLGKKLAEHYNFVYASTSFLIAEEIRRDTIHGRKIKLQFLNNELVDNFLIQKLIEQRVAKKDCKMQGVVIEGYPKSKEQFDNIKNMRLNPTMIVAIDTPRWLSQSRCKDSKEKFNERYEHWQVLSAHLRQSKEKIFWVNPELNVGNLFQQVVHQFQKQFV